ncbi:glycosyltransferase family 2 protein [Paenibacillus spiritus]|uniref:Glycosyltransferase family 2 protein n=1 Tax=Paenibacillus spiritus TaxID=2496557 RepID=A0A5J5GM46_9BACL|nr:glycosyltransferase family A protein [Paenibacillus spiritus]KAA9008562.1 glycosyltransferase family 2 protein [Paenibacillus spiritus]
MKSSREVRKGRRSAGFACRGKTLPASAAKRQGQGRREAGTGRSGRRPGGLGRPRRNGTGASAAANAALAPRAAYAPRVTPGGPFPPLRERLSVIVTARNEEQTLPAVLRQAARLKPDELIVVLNGCTDGSYAAARRFPEVIIVHCPEAAGHDVGRGIGAKLARGGILLFLDGDLPIAAEDLYPFAAAVDKGTDAALNDLGPLLPPFSAADTVTRCKLLLNEALGRRDLGAASMTAVPHALSRRALETIGPSGLAVPPRAQAIAVLEGLRVETAGTVDVIRRNRRRGADNTGSGNRMEQLIAGDHAEALGELLARRGAEGRSLPPGCRLPGSGHLSPQNTAYRRIVAAWRNAK